MVLANNPSLKKDANYRDLQNSYGDLAFRGDYTGTNLIYRGLARPGASEDGLVWQIAKLAYDGSNNLTSITWPQNSAKRASSQFEFSWTNRASYTYS